MIRSRQSSPGLRWVWMCNTLKKTKDFYYVIERFKVALPEKANKGKLNESKAWQHSGVTPSRTRNTAVCPQLCEMWRASLCLPVPKDHVVIATSMFPNNNNSKALHTWKPLKKPECRFCSCLKKCYMFLPPFSPVIKTSPLAKQLAVCPAVLKVEVWISTCLHSPLNNNQRITSCECFVSHPWREREREKGDIMIWRKRNLHLLEALKLLLIYVSK